MSKVAEPIPVHPTEHGNLELPAKRLTRLQSSFWAPLDRTDVAGGCTAGEEPCVILVTARRPGWLAPKRTTTGTGPPLTGRGRAVPMSGS
jgi:hypothetical protein